MPTLQGAEDCYNAAQRGEVPRDLWVDCVLASNVDPTLAPDGRHVLTCFVQYLPWVPAPAPGTHCENASATRSPAIIGRYAPNVPGPSSRAAC